MTQQELEACLNRALDELFKTDLHLLHVDSSERSISHRLAVHLMHETPEYDVDCEYNRDGFDIKRLGLYERDTKDDNTEAVTVFPDIIIHRRGGNKNNLLAIELKKWSSNIAPDYDLLKLNAFRKELQYTYAVHITLGMVDKAPARKIVWV